MALELNTDGTTQAATTGDTAVNLAGNYAATVLGATFQWCAGFFGAYTAFIRIVTGVTIDIQTPISISIFGGYRVVVQGGACTTVSKISETNVKADVMKKITNLEELTSNQTQITEGGIFKFTTLTQKVDTKISNYDVEEKNGDTSTETWTDVKNICSASYLLTCEESAKIGTGETQLTLDLTGAKIIGDLIELN